MKTRLKLIVGILVLGFAQPSFGAPGNKEEKKVEKPQQVKGEKIGRVLEITRAKRAGSDSSIRFVDLFNGTSRIATLICGRTPSLRSSLTVWTTPTNSYESHLFDNNQQCAEMADRAVSMANNKKEMIITLSSLEESKIHTVNGRQVGRVLEGKVADIPVEQE